MSTLPSTAQLQQALQITQQIEELERELKSILGDGITPWPKTAASAEAAPRKKRTMSAGARKRIAAAQRARWARAKVETTSISPAPAPEQKAGADSSRKTKGKRTMSPEARAHIVAAQKKRWAKFRKGKM